MESADSLETRPIIVPEKESEYLNIHGGNFGFTYTTDKALPTILKHGLLSRMEERKRGLNVRIHNSRSIPNTIYFTTLPNDVYALSDAMVADDIMSEVVGVTIGRPDYAKKHEGHFGVEDFVSPENFKVLVFIDQHTTDTGVSRYGVPRYKFSEPLSANQIESRLKTLREICQERGLDIPIYGVSGDMYWPERRNMIEIRMMRFNESAVKREK